MPTESGTGWRRDFGIAFAVLMVLTTAVAVVLLVWRRKMSPLHIRPWRLQLMGSVGGLLMLEVPLREALGEENFPCAAYMMMVNLFVPAWATPLMLSAFRVAFLCELEGIKSRYAEGDKSVTKEVIQAMYVKRQRYSNAFAIIAVVVVLLPFVAVVVALFVTSDEFSTTAGCDLPDSAVITFVVFAVVFLALCLRAFALLWRRQEDYGLKREFAVLFTVCFVSLTVWFILKLAVDEEGNQWGYVVAYVPVVQNIITIIIPALATFGLVVPGIMPETAKPPDKSRFDLETFLLVGEGFDIFHAHMVKELAAENILFWRQATDYAHAPSAKRAQYLYDTYFDPESLLEVNVSHDARREIDQRAADEFRDPPANLFAKATSEVMGHMERDSLPRFLASKLWESYSGVRDRSGSTTVMRSRGSSSQSRGSRADSRTGLTSGSVLRAESTGRRSSADSRTALTSVRRSGPPLQDAADLGDVEIDVDL